MIINNTGNLASVGDSIVNLCWETNKNACLKTWVFSRVRLIHRLTKSIERYWVKGTQNPADFATKIGYDLDLLKEGSKWIEGYPWMKLSIDEMVKKREITH